MWFFLNHTFLVVCYLTSKYSGIFSLLITSSLILLQSEITFYMISVFLHYWDLFYSPTYVGRCSNILEKKSYCYINFLLLLFKLSKYFTDFSIFLSIAKKRVLKSSTTIKKINIFAYIFVRFCFMSFEAFDWLHEYLWLSYVLNVLISLSLWNAILYLW